MNQRSKLPSGKYILNGIIWVSVEGDYICNNGDPAYIIVMAAPDGEQWRVTYHAPGGEIRDGVLQA